MTSYPYLQGKRWEKTERGLGLPGVVYETGAGYSTFMDKKRNSSFEGGGKSHS